MKKNAISNVAIETFIKNMKITIAESIKKNMLKSPVFKSATVVNILSSDEIEVLLTGYDTGENVTVRNSLGLSINVGDKLYIAAIRNNLSNAYVAINIDDSSVLHANEATAISSKKYKHSIADISIDSDRLLELSSKQFRYNDSKSVQGDRLRFGFIAEDVNSILPELVYLKNNTIEGINYLDMIPLMLNIIKKQDMRISELEQHIKEV